jgi:hypothetical protein
MIGQELGVVEEAMDNPELEVLAIILEVLIHLWQEEQVEQRALA